MTTPTLPLGDEDRLAIHRAVVADDRRARRIRDGQARVDVPATLVRDLLASADPATVDRARDELGVKTLEALRSVPDEAPELEKAG